jgi:S-DNA-T family DNA segregation ATPase FtsK/SpoIIIE
MALQKTGELKSLDENLQALVQKCRSLGFRVMAATQRADVKVITGNIKVNFPVVVCFYVPKAVDSMVMLDEPGAENLTGLGDGLIKSPQYRQITRFQAYYKA